MAVKRTVLKLRLDLHAALKLQAESEGRYIQHLGDSAVENLLKLKRCNKKKD